MKNMIEKDMSQVAISARWSKLHPDDEISAVGQSNNGIKTNLASKIDENDIIGMGLFTQILLKIQERANLATINNNI